MRGFDGISQPLLGGIWLLNSGFRVGLFNGFRVRGFHIQPPADGSRRNYHAIPCSSSGLQDAGALTEWVSATTDRPLSEQQLYQGHEEMMMSVTR